MGGSMDISNLVPACRKCNLTKGNSGIEEFRAKVLEEMSSEYNFSVKQKNILIKKYGSIPDIPAFSFWFEENM